MTEPSPTMNLAEAAKALGISVPTLRKMVRANRLPQGVTYYKLERQYRFSRASIERLVGTPG